MPPLSPLHPHAFIPWLWYQTFSLFLFASAVQANRSSLPAICREISIPMAPCTWPFQGEIDRGVGGNIPLNIFSPLCLTCTYHRGNIHKKSERNKEKMKRSQASSLHAVLRTPSNVYQSVTALSMHLLSQLVIMAITRFLYSSKVSFEMIME